VYRVYLSHFAETLAWRCVRENQLLPSLYDIITFPVVAAECSRIRALPDARNTNYFFKCIPHVLAQL